MDQSNFHALADETLERLVEAIEIADEDGVLDVEYIGSICTIDLPDGKQIVINKHEPSVEIWLSSPKSGAVHFHYDDDERGWISGDEETLFDVVSHDLLSLTGLDIQF